MINNKKENPYLSIVVVSRNDNHGNHLLERTQMFIDSLLEQLENNHLKSELIIVEWNPPPDKPLLKDVFKWPTNLKCSKVRIIQVPASIHKKYKGSERIFINVSSGLNCGIRRAKGDFVLSGSVDLLYSEELISYISQKKLERDKLYKVERSDISSEIFENFRKYDTLKKRLSYCQKNIIFVHSNDFYTREGLPDLHTSACGDFLLTARDNWYLIRGYREEDFGLSHIDSVFSYCSYAAGIREIVLKKPIMLYHVDHESSFTKRTKVKRPGIDKLIAGPFRLIRPLLPKKVNAKIVFFYHKIIKKMKKNESYSVPTLDYIDYLNLARDVVSGEKPYFLNGENWGLGGESLTEFIIE